MPSDVYFIMCPKCKTPMRVDAPACVNCGRENPAAQAANGAQAAGGSPVMTGKAALLEDTPRPKIAIIASCVAVAALGIFLCLRGFGVFGGNDENDGSTARSRAAAANEPLKRFAGDEKALNRKNAAPTPPANSGVTYMGGGGGAAPPPPPMPVYQPPVNNYGGGGGTAVGSLPTYQAPPPQRSAPIQFANQNQGYVSQPSLPAQSGAPGEGLSRGYGTPSQNNDSAVIVGSHSGGGGGGN